MPSSSDIQGQILQSATRRFAAHGFDGTSLKAIADDVGIRKPSLLYHFASKEQLRLAVLDRLLEHWNDVLPKLLLAATSKSHRFEAVIHELVSFFAADPDRARLLLREILDRPEDMTKRMRDHVTPWIKVVADQIREEQAAGLIHRQVDPEAYVLQVINMVVCGVATHASMATSLLPSSDDGSSDGQRLTRELQRMAGFSLFRAPQKNQPHTDNHASSAASNMTLANESLVEPMASPRQESIHE